MPDALGSVSLGRDKQVVDGIGGVVDAREWSPYGVEVGDAQAGLGYTGEWWDAAVGLQVLRARWYDARTGAFLTRDPVESNHPYQYANANPMRYLDPAGLCAQLPCDSADCVRFIREVESIVGSIKKERQGNCLLRALTSDETLAIDFLAWYYFGLPFSWGPLFLAGLPLRVPDLSAFPRMPVNTPRDRYRVPDWSGRPQDPPVLEWNHPMLDKDSLEGLSMRSTYGFKRVYFEQTHHYFAFLKIAFHGGSFVANQYNYWRGIEDELKPTRRLVLGNWGSEEPFPEFYRFHYEEALGDLYLVQQAGQDAMAVAVFGVDVLSAILQSWCADNDCDVWALGDDVASLYYKFPHEYWPETVLAGWGKER